MVRSAVLREEWKSREVSERIAINSDVEIYITIAVVIEKARSHCWRHKIKPHLPGAIRKCAITVVMKKSARRQVANYEEVFKAIVVNVCEDACVCLVYSVQTCLRRDIGEAHSAGLRDSIVAIQSTTTTIGKEDVVATVVVIVAHADAAEPMLHQGEFQRRSR